MVEQLSNLSRVNFLAKENEFQPVLFEPSPWRS